ncbi:MAG: D-glycero-beta-D-manno-heptose 1-phosphate adenylyltransferase [Bacteroidetes bacterium]|nr:MAG: D-glycero-beta-D-manno-heptose 1-phosphate adenylyltransferase [Bacteroidota bacterium]
MPYHSSDKILSLERLLAKVRAWRVKDHRIIFTNGCFDLLHLGHIDYLERAKQLGGKLVLGLNSDASVRRIKGPKRPLMDENTRARMLAAMEFVDAVIIFEEDTPIPLLLQLKPDVLVKGGDYRLDEIVGHEEVQAYGGEVQRVPFLEGYSTTGMLEKLKSLLT